MTPLHKIVIHVDIGMLLSWNFQKPFKTKFGLLKNCGRPKAYYNFSILKERFWLGKIYPPPWRIRLKSLCSLQYGGKCLSISLRNFLPIFVTTDLLNRGLNHIIFLFLRSLCWVLLGIVFWNLNLWS